MAAGGLRLLKLVLLVLNWCSWVVFLGGLAGFTSYCNDEPADGTKSNTALYVDEFGGSKCKHYYALPWWAVWFDFVVLIMASALLCVKTPLLIRSTLLYLAIVSALMMVVADDANLLLEPLDDLKKELGDAKNAACEDAGTTNACSNAGDYYDNAKGAYMSVQAMLAGLCMVLIFNMLTIILESGYELAAPVHGAHAAPVQVEAGKPSYTSNPTYMPGSIQMQPGAPTTGVPTVQVPHVPTPPGHQV